jgi:hypothetical protein
MINLSFSELKGKQRSHKILVEGRLLSGATAHIYEESEAGTHFVPKYTVASFRGASINAIRPYSVSELFAHLNQFNIRVRIRGAIAKPGDWGFGDLRVRPNIVKKNNTCYVFAFVEVDPDNWDRPYSISDLAECIHFGLNGLEGEYAFQADTPQSLAMGFGVYTFFPDTVKIEEILRKIVSDFEYLAGYTRKILETKPPKAPILGTFMQSTFISYGGPDEDFARRIYDSLKKMGVVVFFFPETAQLGERIDAEVFKRINDHDRVLLICSKDSLKRPGVTHEIRETLDREARDGGATYLLPITLDNYVFEEFKERHSDLAERLSRRIIGDFRGAKNSRMVFQKAMRRIVETLAKPPTGTRGTP